MIKCFKRFWERFLRVSLNVDFQMKTNVIVFAAVCTSFTKENWTWIANVTLIQCDQILE